MPGWAQSQQIIMLVLVVLFGGIQSGSSLEFDIGSSTVFEKSEFPVLILKLVFCF